MKILIVLVIVGWYLDPRIDKLENNDTIIWYGRNKRKWFKLW